VKIVTVLRSGGEFKPEHVLALKRQCAEYAPFAEFLCLTDTIIPGVACRLLKTEWPRWWAKMELFDPHMKGDFLYMDLDTVVCDSLSDIMQCDELTLLRDFYRDGVKLKKGLGSGLMYLPEPARWKPWDIFSANAKQIMSVCAGGDQKFLENVWGTDIPTWQGSFPDQVVSYKVHCCQQLLGKGPVFKSVPQNARIICFHGQPRPWAVKEFEELYL
jgi:hypothetical protein